MPMGTYGDLSGPMGTYGGPWAPMGACGDLWAPMRAYGDLCNDCNGLRCICGQAPYSMDLLRSMGEYLCQVILLWRGYPESLKRANLGYKTCANIPPSHKHCTTKRATQ